MFALLNFADGGETMPARAGTSCHALDEEAYDGEADEARAAFR